MKYKDDAEFVASVLLGLAKAATSDIDVCLLAVAGVIGGRKALSSALITYVIARRADQYMSVIDSKLDRFAAVMGK